MSIRPTHQSVRIETENFIAIFELEDSDGSIETARHHVCIFDGDEASDAIGMRGHQTSFRSFTRPADVPDRSTGCADDAHIEDVIEGAADHSIVELKFIEDCQAIVSA
jgi:hypothetical protein